MNLPFQAYVALRYLKSRKRHKSISFNTVISVAGVALGVMALLVVLSVMSGFHDDLRRKILGASAHVVVLDSGGPMHNYPDTLDRLLQIPHVVSGSPFVLGQVMVSAGERAQGVYMRGIDPSLERATTEIASHMVSGSLEDLSESGEEPGIILGRELALRLGVVRGDTVTLMSPNAEIGPMGMLPRLQKFQVAGVFEIGMFEYDSNLTLAGMKAVQEFLEIGNDVTGIELRLDDIFAAPAVGDAVAREIGLPYYAKDWMQMNRNLFAALKLEKFTMFVILTLIVLVAAFNIVSTLIMNVIEKEPEIAILKAMGATSRGIMGIFMLQGFLIGLFGTAIGLVGGYVIGYLLDTYQLIKLPADVYYLSHLPARMNPWDFVTVSVSAVLISFLATIYPARQAARLDPIEPLRYE